MNAPDRLPSRVAQSPGEVVDYFPRKPGSRGNKSTTSPGHPHPEAGVVALAGTTLR
jgi:hypothetical protein